MVKNVLNYKALLFTSVDSPTFVASLRTFNDDAFQACGWFALRIALL
jgi:hypothetical protein